MSIEFFGPNLPPVEPARPVRALFLTSVRDVVHEDQNGQVVETAEGPRYMHGIVEKTIEETGSGGRLEDMVEVACVVTDDDARDAERLGIARHPSEKGGRWLARDWDRFDVDVRNTPSHFRRISKAIGYRHKRAFERQLLEIMKECRADILVSDHYMARLSEEFCTQDLMPGAILNIHPAPTAEGDKFCFRGKTPTADALALARSEQGQVYTGATMHVVNETIDDGPALAVSTGTPVYPADSPESLRYRNYQLSKLPVFVEGLRHYVRNVYPYLGRIDLDTLLRLETPLERLIR
jgi:folate-dependent phosphoribosylglycinamide formyltransferase PurN